MYNSLDIFAWGQSCLNLSAWLGMGTSLNLEKEADKKERKKMYQQQPWFFEIIDLLAMILSKTNYLISQNYDNLLVNNTEN